MVVGHLTRDLLGGSYLGKKTHPNHGGRRRPTAAMVPHSRRRDIRQSANMLGDCSMQRLRVWGAPWRPQSTIFMSRRVDGRSFFLWFVSYVGIRRTHTGKSVMPSRHKVRKSIIIAGIGARRLGSLQAESAVQPRSPVRHTVEARCVAAAASEKAGEEEYEAFFYNMKKNASIDHGGSPSLYSRPWGPAPGAEAHNTISQHATRQVNVVNTREYICYYYSLAI